jgi:hypothetical protein
MKELRFVDAAECSHCESVWFLQNLDEAKGDGDLITLQYEYFVGFCPDCTAEIVLGDVIRPTAAEMEDE